jgi:hypothetical protein
MSIIDEVGVVKLNKKAVFLWCHTAQRTIPREIYKEFFPSMSHTELSSCWEQRQAGDRLMNIEWPQHMPFSGCSPLDFTESLKQQSVESDIPGAWYC